MMRATALVALLATFALSSAAQARRPVAPPPSERIIISVVVYGEDRCPVAEGDEIVVCARKPESERYRIPRDLRRAMVTPGPQTWSSRVATIEAEGRKILPGSCSAIGANGQTGCLKAALNRWALERQQQQRQADALP